MRILIAEQVFLVDLIVLKSDGDIDVILGVGWLTKHKGLISCSPRLVSLENPSGIRVQIDAELRIEDEKNTGLHA